MNKIGDHGCFAYAHLPGEFAKNRSRFGATRLKMPVTLAQIVDHRKWGRFQSRIQNRHFLTNGHVIPVTVVFRQITKALVRVEQYILAPGIFDVINSRTSSLIADYLVIRAAQLTARSQRNQWSNVRGDLLEFLQNLEVRIFGIEHAMATAAHHGNRLAKRAQHNRCAAVRALQGFHLWLWRTRGWRKAGVHYHPSNERRFFRRKSSNSTNSPRYSTGCS